MNLVDARKALKRTGCKNAEGPALAAMYTDVILDAAPGVRSKIAGERIYAHLRTVDQPRQEVKRLLSDPLTLTDIARGLG
jgi:hypothetical protein